MNPEKTETSAPLEVLSDTAKLRTALISLLDRETVLLNGKTERTEREKTVSDARRRAMRDLLCGIELAQHIRHTSVNGARKEADTILQDITENFIHMLSDSEFAASSQYMIDNYDLAQSVRAAVPTD